MAGLSVEAGTAWAVAYMTAQPGSSAPVGLSAVGLCSKAAFL